jgi:hypothetical protein
VGRWRERERIIWGRVKREIESEQRRERKRGKEIERE